MAENAVTGLLTRLLTSLVSTNNIMKSAVVCEDNAVENDRSYRIIWVPTLHFILIVRYMILFGDILFAQIYI